MMTPSMLFIMPLMMILYLISDQCSGQNTMDNDYGSYSCDTCIIGGRRGRSLCRGCVQGASDAQFSCRRCSPGSDPSAHECRGCTNNNPEFGEKSQETYDFIEHIFKVLSTLLTVLRAQVLCARLVHVMINYLQSRPMIVYKCC